MSSKIGKQLRIKSNIRSQALSKLESEWHIMFSREHQSGRKSGDCVRYQWTDTRTHDPSKYPDLDRKVCQHDLVIVDVENRLPGQETAIHWHGVTQRGSPYMDGVPMVTQCPIHSNSRFQYTFKATNPGTHFYHAHAVTQHAGGVFGPLLVKQPLQDDPHADLYEFDLEEHVVILSSLVPSTLIVDLNLRENFTKPKSKFRGHAHFMVNPGYKYKLRVINAISSDCPVLFSIDSHQVTIVEKDGAPVQSQDITKLVILPGERYDLVLNADKEVAVYNMRVKGYHFCQHVHQEALLIYDGAESLKEEIPLAGGK
ncbi:unnamed protein product, partial [Timema podura]|nr:unnamed protein product [Timema podura]